MEPPSGRPYPEVAALAARIASLEGLPTVVDAGMVWTPEMAVLHPELHVIGAGASGEAVAGRPEPRGFPFERYADLSGEAGRSLLAGLDLARTAVLVTEPTAPVVPDDVMRQAALVITATTTPSPMLARLEALGRAPSFAGHTPATEADSERTAAVFIADRSIVDTGAAPPDFRVVAIMTAYNEEDIIAASIGKLVADGVGVYVIDNWSTDNTYAIAEQFRGRGLVGLERFPRSPTDRFSLRSLLPRVEAVAAGLDAAWCIHHDADERRCGPWPGVGLRDALWRVDRAGFNAVDHTVLNYRPIDNGFTPGGDFEAYFRHFEFGRTSDLRLQVKAWKNSGRVDLASRAGHEAQFRGRRIYPYKFELKHYPIRSQAHGDRKIFRDRIPRWDPRERRLAWHVQYDAIRPAQSFLRAAEDLIEDHGAETHALYLPVLVAGAGLADDSFPAWALRSFRGRAAYLARRRMTRSRPFTAASWLCNLPSRAARKVLRLARARSSGHSRSSLDGGQTG